MPKSAPHLSDIFAEGREFTVVYPGKPDIPVWIDRPDPGQMERVIRGARIERARRYHELTEEDSAEALALRDEVETMTKEEVVEELLGRKRRELEQQAFNDILFAKETEEDSGVTEFGSYWGPEGQQWTDVLDALIKRMTEIEDTNKELKAAGAKEILMETDEEIERLTVIQDKFQGEVLKRYNTLREQALQEIGVGTVKDLRAKLVKERIELDCEAVWFTHYKYSQLYYAVRYPDNQSQLYFKDSAAIRALPKPIQDQLFDAFDDLNLQGDALKNLLTPLPS